MFQVLPHIIGSAALLCLAFSARASFHTFRINELYSNAAGTVQFVELREASGASGQNFFQGITLASGSGNNRKTFTFPANLPSSDTAGKSVLIGTQGFAALGLVTPDYTIPNGFLSQGEGEVKFGDVDTVHYTQLPSDGTTSINRNGVSQTNSPRNFAGQTATISPPPPAGSVTEFYNTILDHYFITADASEAAAIDSGSAGPGWSRTGNSFKAGGSTAVCRFYGSLSPGPNSHFYTADPGECAFLKQLQASTPAAEKRWNFESNDFNTTVAVNRSCPGGTTSVYRAYNNGFARNIDSNHRITSNLTAINDVVARGWINEGVVMCAQP